MAVRSRNESRYMSESQGMRCRSIWRLVSDCRVEANPGN